MAVMLAEPGPPVLLTEFVLVDGVHAAVAEHRTTAPLRRGVTLDLDALG